MTTAEDLRQRIDGLWNASPEDDGQATPFRLQTRKASTIAPKDINWVWKPWQPAGMIGLFAGYGGSGKSTVALSIAAACSVGGMLPDGQRAPLLNTLVFAAEDSPDHTIIPRLLATGADLERIHIVDGIARDGEDPGWVQLRNHVSMIEQAVIDNGIGLVIIDPVSSYIGDANGDKESDVRAGIMPIVAMAERTGAAVLLIRHVSKAGDGTRAASRILGSTAWHDIPRVAWMLADAPDDHQPEPREDGTRDTRRVLGVVKSNLAAKPPARWCIQPVDGPLRWLPDPSPVTVDECFFSQSNRGGKGRDAEEWLKERLAGGSQPSKTVESAAKDAGISKAALKRARASLNVKARKEPTGEWVLSLPPRLSVVTSEGAHPETATGHVQEVNALHNVSDAKAFTMNPLNPFPESQRNRPLEPDAETATEQVEESKGFNSTLKGPDEPLLTSQREVMELDSDPQASEEEWSITI